MSTALVAAVKAGDIARVRDLLKEADADLRGEEGRTLLMLASGTGNLLLVQALLAAGADIEAAIGYGVRPLMLAAGYGETEVVDALLAAGADVLARNEGGYTALMMVKQKHYVDVINLLHEAELLAGAGEAGCESRNAPDSSVITFMKRPAA